MTLKQMEARMEEVKASFFVHKREMEKLADEYETLYDKHYDMVFELEREEARLIAEHDRFNKDIEDLYYLISEN